MVTPRRHMRPVCNGGVSRCTDLAGRPGGSGERERKVCDRSCFSRLGPSFSSFVSPVRYLGRMKVTIQVSFEVSSEEEELNEMVARAAAEQAAYDYLSLVTVSGVNTDTSEVTVHVDGFGECLVSLADR